MKQVYSVHPGVKMLQEWVSGLKGKTGRSLEEWIALVEKKGPKEEKARRDWLRTEHGLGSNASWWIAERSLGTSVMEEDPAVYLREAERYVGRMYGGPRAALRPIYDRLLAMGLGLGPDAKACPCKTMVPLYRRHVFAEIKPAANGRIDLGLALGESKAEGRLVDTGGWKTKDRITHRIPITALAEVDGEVARWLKTAYERDREDALRRAPAKDAKVPADLAKAVLASKKARATFDALAPGMRRDFVAWVEGAKQAETRTRRIERAVKLLAAGKRRVY